MSPIATHQICIERTEEGLNRAYDFVFKIAYLFCLDPDTSFRTVLVLIEALENSFLCQNQPMLNGAVCARIEVAEQEIRVNVKDQSLADLFQMHSNLSPLEDRLFNQEIGPWIIHQLSSHITFNELGANVCISVKRGGVKLLN